MERSHVSTVGYPADTTIPRDKTSSEVLIDRLLTTAQRMATHNDIASSSLDRLVGGEPRSGTLGGRSEQPSPVDFVGHAALLLDRIGAELERMESNAVRLSRFA